jgi:DNA polymerase-3 subunit delta'
MEIVLDQVWGQQLACATLSHNIERNMVASSYLFCGPDGVGKSLTANIFAKALLCQDDSVKPCGKCKSCLLFNERNHPDFFNVTREGSKQYGKSGNIIITEQIRDLISALSLKSYMGGRKIALILEAEAMNRATANAFLKTLEEPPSKTIIILVSANPSSLLPTVVSRCRNLPFVPMEPSKLAELLQTRLGTSPEEALRLALLADGCVGKTLGGGMDNIKAIDDSALNLMHQIPAMRVEGVLKNAREWKDRRGDLSVLLDRMAEILRFSMKRDLKFSSDIMSRVTNMYGGMPVDRVIECFDLLLDAAQRLKLNPNIQLFLESLIFNMQSVLQKGYRIGTTYNR